MADPEGDPPPEGLADDVEEEEQDVIYMSPLEQKRRLVLHFCAPKTLFTYDPNNKESTTEKELQSMIIQMSWGSIHAETGDWLLASEEPTWEAPDDGFVSYRDYLEEKFPTDEEDDQLREENIEQQRQRITTFFGKGQPGQKLKPFWDQMVRCLTLPGAVRKAAGVDKPKLNEQECPVNPDKDAKSNLVRTGRYQIIPSFYNLITALGKEKRNFSIVFHGNQQELDVLQEEWNMFCEADHPSFKNKKLVFNGDKGSRDLRCQPENRGVLNVIDERLEFKARVPPEAPVDEASGEGEERTGTPPAEGAGSEKPATPVIPIKQNYEGWRDIYSGLLFETLDKVQTAMIETSGQDPHVLLINEAETHVQHVWFSREAPEIRDAVTGQVVEDDETLAATLCPDLDFWRTVTDQAYFEKLLTKASELQEERIHNMKRETKVQSESGGLDLSSLPAKDYLYKTVIPSVLPALEVCLRDRPADPILSIALYLLRHPQMYNKSLDEPAPEAPPTQQ